MFKEAWDAREPRRGASGHGCAFGVAFVGGRKPPRWCLMRQPHSLLERLAMTAAPLWAITTFYNPRRYRGRLANFRRFRAALRVPLVAVEASFSGGFELSEGDADVLVQLKAHSVMWQKERLLNVALRHVPAGVDAVAWLDCDILFEVQNWYEHAMRQLQESHIVQLFSHLYDMQAGAVDAPLGFPREHDPSGLSIAHLVGTGADCEDSFRPTNDRSVRNGSFGLAWAARRDLLQAHGFYDAMIVGSGDRAMACASFGRFDDAINSMRLSAIRQRHYREWSRPWFESVRGVVGCVPGGLLHLWHGAIAHRRYLARHEELAAFGFDPYTDIAVDAVGCWRWATEKQDLHDYLREYFERRSEDDVDDGTRVSLE